MGPRHKCQVASSEQVETMLVRNSCYLCLLKADAKGAGCLPERHGRHPLTGLLGTDPCNVHHHPLPPHMGPTGYAVTHRSLPSDRYAAPVTAPSDLPVTSAQSCCCAQRGSCLRCQVRCAALTHRCSCAEMSQVHRGQQLQSGAPSLGNASRCHHCLLSSSETSAFLLIRLYALPLTLFSIVGNMHS